MRPQREPRQEENQAQGGLPVCTVRSGARLARPRARQCPSPAPALALRPRRGRSRAHHRASACVRAPNCWQETRKKMPQQCPNDSGECDTRGCEATESSIWYGKKGAKYCKHGGRAFSGIYFRLRFESDRQTDSFSRTGSAPCTPHDVLTRRSANAQLRTWLTVRVECVPNGPWRAPHPYAPRSAGQRVGEGADAGGRCAAR